MNAAARFARDQAQPCWQAASMKARRTPLCPFLSVRAPQNLAGLRTQRQPYPSIYNLTPDIMGICPKTLSERAEFRLNSCQTGPHDGGGKTIKKPPFFFIATYATKQIQAVTPPPSSTAKNSPCDGEKFSPYGLRGRGVSAPKPGPQALSRGPLCNHSRHPNAIRRGGLASL